MDQNCLLREIHLCVLQLIMVKMVKTNATNNFPSFKLWSKLNSSHVRWQTVAQKMQFRSTKGVHEVKLYDDMKKKSELKDDGTLCIWWKTSR